MLLLLLLLLLKTVELYFASFLFWVRLCLGSFVFFSLFLGFLFSIFFFFFFGSCDVDKLPAIKFA